MDTLQYVRACLDRTEKTNREVARGAGVGESWLRAFRKGDIPNPGYNSIKLLAEYFMRAGEIPVLHEQQSASSRQGRQMG